MLDKLITLLPWCFGCLALYWGLRRLNRKNRSAQIQSFALPPSLAQKVLAKYPHLTINQAEEVLLGLREYFQICNQAGTKMVSMPSQVVDVAWHEFILFTRHYDYFCRKALGRFLHHTPAEAMKTPTMAEKGIRTAWDIACIREDINPKSPNRLPALFELDTKLNIPDGFKYTLNCKLQQYAGEQVFCASHISCGSSYGCTSSCCGSSDVSSSSSNEGFSCSGGCGGGD